MTKSEYNVIAPFCKDKKVKSHLQKKLQENKVFQDKNYVKLNLKQIISNLNHYYCM